MNFKKFFASIVCMISMQFALFPAASAELIPMKQGMHQWSVHDGKVMATVSTYQDSTTLRHSYNFYFVDPKEGIWNQVPLKNKAGRPQIQWDSAVGGEVTLADGVVSARKEGFYFIVADKQASQSYQDKGDITVTWYKLTESSDENPDDPPYQLKPDFIRSYPKSAVTVESVLTKELSLQPRK
jgi:hypothetical protein